MTRELTVLLLVLALILLILIDERTSAPSEQDQSEQPAVRKLFFRH